MPRAVAKSVARASRATKDRADRQATWKSVDNVIDMYLQLNFPEVHERLEHSKQQDDEFTLDDVPAENMDKMLMKLKTLAGV